MKNYLIIACIVILLGITQFSSNSTDRDILSITILAPIMGAGVRIGGAPVFPTSFRWGFGRDIN